MPPDRRTGGGHRPAPQRQRQANRQSEDGPIPVLAMATGSVDAAVRRGRVTPTTRATFQAVALLVRELRDLTKTAEMPEARRAEQLRRIDGLATALAKTAAREGSLLSLLAEGATILPGTSTELRELRVKTGLAEPDPPPSAETTSRPGPEDRQVMPASVRARIMSNPLEG